VLFRSAHQIQNGGIALAALRALEMDEAACEAALTRPSWPARMQRLRLGPLIEVAQQGELWLDGGHNASAGLALAEALTRLPKRQLHLICGMLNTKDVTGYLRPLVPLAESLHAVSVPGEVATLPASETCAAAQNVGMTAFEATSTAAAVAEIVAQAPNARILICGSLYLAGNVLRENS